MEAIRWGASRIQAEKTDNQKILLTNVWKGSRNKLPRGKKKKFVVEKGSMKTIEQKNGGTEFWGKNHLPKSEPQREE